MESLYVFCRSFFGIRRRGSAAEFRELLFAQVPLRLSGLFRGTAGGSLCAFGFWRVEIWMCQNGMNVCEHPKRQASFNYLCSKKMATFSLFNYVVIFQTCPL